MLNADRKFLLQVLLHSQSELNRRKVLMSPAGSESLQEEQTCGS